jgi:mono/diheme cytochrome c family protein
MKNYSPFLFCLVFSLIMGTNIGCSQNKNDSTKDSAKSQDSSYNQNTMGQNMRGSGMMNNGRMIGNGMMGNGNMMGNGMMSGQGYNSNNQGGSWVAPKSADNLKNPVAGIVAATKKGQNIFNTQCSICHGEKGLGNGIGGASLHPHPANLTADSVQNQSDGAIFWKITTGNPPMASYKNVLSDKERWDLINYIRKLGKK